MKNECEHIWEKVEYVISFNDISARNGYGEYEDYYYKCTECGEEEDYI